MKLVRNSIILVSLGLVVSLCVLIYLSPPKSHYQYLNFSSNVVIGENYLGIDVSHYQGEINWEEVDSVQHDGDSISFVFIKATEGENLVDPKFELNSEEVKTTDLKFGFYHFFRPKMSARKQAEHFIQKIMYKEASLKPVLDVEIIEDMDSQELLDSIDVFMSVAESNLDTEIIIYTYFNFYQDHLKSSLENDQLIWIANYNNDYAFDRQEFAQIWQFSDKGTVDGIGTAVDLNIAKKSSWKVIQDE